MGGGQPGAVQQPADQPARMGYGFRNPLTNSGGAPSQDTAYDVGGTWRPVANNPGMVHRFNENTGQDEMRPAPSGQSSGQAPMWPDASRGLSQPGMSYAQMLTPVNMADPVEAARWRQSQPQQPLGGGVHTQGRVTWDPASGRYVTSQAPGVQYPQQQQQQQQPWQQSMPSWASYNPYGYSNSNPYASYSPYSAGSLSPYLYANPTYSSMYQQPYSPYSNYQNYNQSYNPYSFGQQLSGWNSPIQNPAAMLTGLQFLNQPVQTPYGQVPQSMYYSQYMNPNLQQQNQMTPGGGSASGEGGSMGSGVSGATAGTSPFSAAMDNPAGMFGLTGNTASLANLGGRAALGMLSPPLGAAYGLVNALNPSGYFGNFAQSMFNTSPQMDPALAAQMNMQAALGLGYGYNGVNGIGANGIGPGMGPSFSMGPMGSINFDGGMSGLGGATGVSSTGVAFGGPGQSPNLNTTTAQSQNLNFSDDGYGGGGPGPGGVGTGTSGASAAAASAAAAEAEATGQPTGASTDPNGPGSGAGSGECFPGTMMVRMADQSLLPIKDVKAGDSVISIDCVESDRPFRKTMLLLNNLLVTSPHRFAVGHDEWKEAGDLRVGDKVMTQTGMLPITRTLGIPSTAKVYNLHVPDTLNFFVTDGGKFRYLVHNGGK